MFRSLLYQEQSPERGIFCNWNCSVDIMAHKCLFLGPIWSPCLLVSKRKPCHGVTFYLPIPPPTRCWPKFYQGVTFLLSDAPLRSSMSTTYKSISYSQIIGKITTVKEDHTSTRQWKWYVEPQLKRLVQSTPNKHQKQSDSCQRAISGLTPLCVFFLIYPWKN